jgi:hypothetical protein
MDSKVSDVVRQYAERYANDLHHRDFRTATRSIKDSRSSLIYYFLMLFAFSCLVVWRIFFRENSDTNGLIIVVSLTMIAYSVWNIFEHSKTLIQAKEKLRDFQMDMQEGVIAARLQDGLRFLAYQMIMRGNIIESLNKHLATIRRAQMAGVRCQVGTREMAPGSAKDSVVVFRQKVGLLISAVQNEFDAVGGAIEQYRGQKLGASVPSLREILHNILTAGLEDNTLQRRLQAIAYEPEGLVTEQFEKLARWKFAGDESLGVLDKMLDELLFTEYMDKWNDDLPEWTPHASNTSVAS